MKREFVPPTVTLKEVHDAVPKHLLKRDELKSVLYIAGDLTMATALFCAATYIDRISTISTVQNTVLAKWQPEVIRWLLWGTYWWFQGVVWAGIFCLGSMHFSHWAKLPTAETCYPQVMMLVLMKFLYPFLLTTLR